MEISSKEILVASFRSLKIYQISSDRTGTHENGISELYYLTFGALGKKRTIRGKNN
jgi:hypothetical protein